MSQGSHSQIKKDRELFSWVNDTLLNLDSGRFDNPPKSKYLYTDPSGITWIGGYVYQRVHEHTKRFKNPRPMGLLVINQPFGKLSIKYGLLGVQDLKGFIHGSPVHFRIPPSHHYFGDFCVFEDSGSGWLIPNDEIMVHTPKMASGRDVSMREYTAPRRGMITHPSLRDGA